VINHHTLSDIQVDCKQELDELFQQLLVSLDEANIISLERVMHDGTKIGARAGTSSFRREPTVQEKLARAKELVDQDPQVDGSKQRQRAPGASTARADRTGRGSA
jgi:hypothetical protein